ncbi:hypothetical protein V5F38_08275 [Xanthobacter sp. V0B-10]|uniref:hypothetical protein n=1 Tax=Xanthobacter albus TaxID=3119929 RepID=UPI00372A9582
MKVAVTLGLLADAGLVVLLLALAGVVFGAGQGGGGEGSAILGWSLTLAVCVIAPLLALPMWRRGRRDIALATIWLPVIALLLGILIGTL